MDSAVPPMPVLDAGRITRLRDVLAGGHLALEADRQLAASITERPLAEALVRNANAFHRRAALWAVCGGTPEFPVPPAAGVIFAACGYPLPGGFHAAAQAARPDALFGYAEPDSWAIMYNLAKLAQPDPEHVFAYAGSARTPESILTAGHALTILERGPVMVQLQLCAQWWPSEFAAWAVRRYAELLPSGSTLALSLGVPGGAAGAPEFLEHIGRAGGTVYPHSEDEVAAWVKGAGLELSPAGVRDVRGRELGWASNEFERMRPVARVIEAVALVP